MSKIILRHVYVSPQIVTGPVLELGRPVLELGRSSPHTGTVPRRGAPYWNWIQDRGFVPKRGAQCWNWVPSAGTGWLSCNPELSPAPYWHWCQYGAPHFGSSANTGCASMLALLSLCLCLGTYHYYVNNILLLCPPCIKKKLRTLRQVST